MIENKPFAVFGETRFQQTLKMKALRAFDRSKTKRKIKAWYVLAVILGKGVRQATVPR